jgi:hypothetical protein
VANVELVSVGNIFFDRHLLAVSRFTWSLEACFNVFYLLVIRHDWCNYRLCTCVNGLHSIDFS